MKHCGNCGVLLSDDYVKDLELRGMPCPNCRKGNYFPTVIGDNTSPFYRRTMERISENGKSVEEFDCPRMERRNRWKNINII